MIPLQSFLMPVPCSLCPIPCGMKRELNARDLTPTKFCSTVAWWLDLVCGRLGAVHRAASVCLRPDWLGVGDRRNVHRPDRATAAVWLDRRRVRGSLGSQTNDDRRQSAERRRIAAAPACALDRRSMAGLLGRISASIDHVILPAGRERADTDLGW